MRRVEQKESGKRANELCAVVNILTANAAHTKHKKQKPKDTSQKIQPDIQIQIHF